MRIIKTNLEGVLVIKPDIFEDFRGEYVEIFNDNLYLSEIKKHLKTTIY